MGLTTNLNTEFKPFLFTGMLKFSTVIYLLSQLQLCQFYFNLKHLRFTIRIIHTVKEAVFMTKINLLTSLDCEKTGEEDRVSHVRVCASWKVEPEYFKFGLLFGPLVKYLLYLHFLLENELRPQDPKTSMPKFEENHGSVEGIVNCEGVLLFSLNVFSLPSVIRVNLLLPWPSLLLYALISSLWSFSILVNSGIVF